MHGNAGSPGSSHPGDSAHSPREPRLRESRLEGHGSCCVVEAQSLLACRCKWDQLSSTVAVPPLAWRQGCRDSDGSGLAAASTAAGSLSPANATIQLSSTPGKAVLYSIKRPFPADGTCRPVYADVLPREGNALVTPRSVCIPTESPAGPAPRMTDKSAGHGRNTTTNPPTVCSCPEPRAL